MRIWPTMLAERPRLAIDAQFLDVVDETAARAAHGVGRPNDDGVADLGGDLFRFLDAEGRGALRHVDAQPLHGFLEDDAVLALFDGVGFDADDADAVFGEHAGLGKLRGEVETGLAAQVGQEGIGPFLLDDLRQGLHRQRLDVGDIRHAGVGHDGGRVGVDQHDLVAEAAQGFAGLGAGIIEFAGLADDDGAGADDQHFLDVIASGHRGFLYVVRSARSSPRRAAQLSVRVIGNHLPIQQNLFLSGGRIRRIIPHVNNFLPFSAKFFMHVPPVHGMEF